MIQNLSHVLAENEISKLKAELDRNVVGLFELGKHHYDFALNLGNHNWRQTISRLYYGVYNIRRAVVLKHNGGFSMDSSDHKNIDKLPDDLESRETFSSNLRALREDRNLADYSHLSAVTDLILSPEEALEFSSLFIESCKQFLLNKGLSL